MIRQLQSTKDRPTPLSHGHVMPYFMIAVILSLSACALSDTGAVDYRRGVLAPQDTTEAPSGDDGSAAGTVTAASSEDPAADGRRVTLEWKYDGTAQERLKIEKNDSVTIRLMQGFIKDCTEGDFDPTDGWGHNCEVAIVVNAFEMDGNAASDFDLTPEGVNKGRLVYFSNDVEENQFLNFSNMPVFGPITYNGGPIGLDIHIIEIEDQTEQTSALLSSLSSIGKTAYPPAAPVLTVLDALGTALLDAGTDDTDFRYSFVLDPNSSDDTLEYARLLVGNYVLVREDNRQAETPWDSLTIDQNEGRLYWKVNSSGGEGQDGEPSGLYRDNTYLAFQVRRNEAALHIDLSQNTFGDFRVKLTELDKARAEKIKGAGDVAVNALQGAISRRAQIESFDNARQRIEFIRNVIASEENGDKASPPSQERLEAHQLAFDLLNEAIQSKELLAKKTWMSRERHR